MSAVKRGFIWKTTTKQKCQIDSHKFGTKIWTQYLQRFKAIKNSYKGYQELFITFVKQ